MAVLCFSFAKRPEGMSASSKTTIQLSTKAVQFSELGRSVLWKWKNKISDANIIPWESVFV